MTKKILSLALAFAMLLGLCTAGATTQDVTTLPDWDTVTDKDSVLLLNTFNIMQGDNRGFRPFDPVRRSKAAKMIAVALWGGNDTVADMYIGNWGSYTDVDAITPAWYMGYVNVMWSLGIMVGHEGRFRPEDTVSGCELLKMCLVSLGYNAETEGLTGDGWDENTMALATLEGQRSLIEGTTVTDWTAPLTRMNSATIIKNMIFRNMVSYTEEGDIEYGSSFAEEVLGIDRSFAEEYFDEGLLDIFEDLFGTTP